MKSARQIVLSLVHATQSLTRKVMGRRGIRVREPLAYLLTIWANKVGGVREVFEQGRDRVVHEQWGKDVPGNPVCTEIVAAPIRDQGGKVVASLELVTPITERKRAEEARAFLASLAESSQDAIIGTTLEALTVSWNHGAEELYGYSAKEMVGNYVSVLYPPDHLDELAQLFEKIRQGERINCYESVRVRKDGTRVDVSLTLSPVYDTTGRITGTVTIARDITERKRAEAEMAERHRLAALVAEVGVALTGAESLRQGLQQCAEILVRDINAAFARIWTVNQEDKVLELEASAGMYTHLDGGHARVPMGQFKIGRIAETGEPHLTNTVQQDPGVKDPEWARREGMVAFAGYPLKVEERVLGVVAAFARKPLTPATLQAFASVARNIAQFIERKRVEETLRESEEKYRALIETTGTGYVIIDTQGRVVDANPEYVRLTGRRALHEILGHRIAEWTAQHDLTRTAEAVRRCAELGLTRNFEIEHVNGDGKCTPIEVNATVVLVAGAVRMVGLCRDITERKRGEKALEERTAYLNTLIETSPVGITVLDKEERVQMCNPAFERLFLYSRQEMQGFNLNEFIVPTELVSEAESLTKQTLGGASMHVTSRRRRKDGTLVDVEIYAVPLVMDDKPLGLLGLYQDITERKRAQAALIEEKNLLHALMDNLPDVIYFKDRESHFIRINKAHAREFGLTDPAQAVGKIDSDFFTGEHAEQAYADEQEIIRTGQPVLGKEEKETWPDGHATWASTTKMPLRDANGDIIGTFGISRDITERKQTEAALIEERYLLRTLMDNVPDVIYFKDRESRFTRINKAHAREFGLNDPAQAVGKTDFDFFTGEHAQQAYDDEQEIIRTGQPVVSKEEKETWPDGHVTWASTTKMPLRDAQGEIVGTFGISRNITERKRVQQALQESEERYRDLAENAAELIQSVSPEGQFLYVNCAWRETLGYSVEEVSHLNMMDVIDTEHLAYYQEVFAKVRRGEAVNDVDTVFVAKTGKKVAVRGSVNCRLVDGKPDATHGIFRDVTARLEIEKMKDEFVSTVSHELRTPLTSIRGALGLLTGGVLSADPAKARRMLDIAVANTDRLIRLINDILDIERIESGRVKLEKRSCDAAGLMVQAMDAVREVANRAGVKLELLPTSGSVLADPDRVVQTLTNLVGNAIKFSPPSSTVTLRATRRDDEMLFEVKDQGRGIPADKLRVIFERFQQVDASDRREKGGTGLGLAICRSIVDQHGGRIWAESELGQGSSFYFTLPLLEEQVEAPLPKASPSQRTVLICDDDPSIRTVLKTLLEAHGYRVLAAGSGMEAIRQAAAWQPDAILLDLLMPGMGGWETLAALRDRPATSEIPVAILSVLPPRETRKNDGVVAAWVQKPVDEARLFQTVSVAISGSSKPARVLVVEDDLDLARVIQEVFEGHGYKVFHAQTGREAIQSAERVFPNLIVLDLALPEGDGFDVVAGLRQNKALRSVPLVVYTAKDIDEAEREKLKLGETVFLTKGRISPEEFEKRVIGLLDGLTCVRPE